MSKKTALYDFQTVIPAIRSVEAEMRICLLSGDSAPWSTLDEALLYEERFVNLLYGTLVLPHRCRDCIDSHRPSIELCDYSIENLVVNLVQSPLVNIESIQRITRNRKIYMTVSLYLGEIPHAPEQRIGNTRSAPAAQCNLHRRILFNAYPEQ